MRLDELRTSLSQLADEVPTEDTRGRLVGVDAKITRAKRTRIATGVAGATAAAVLAALVVAPQLIDNRSAPGPIDRKQDDGKVGLFHDVPKVPTIDEGGITIATSYQNAPLLAHAVSEPGDGSLALEFVPTTSRVIIGDLCAAPKRPDGDWYDSMISINGVDAGGGSCEPVDTTSITSIGSITSDYIDVRPGELNVLRLSTQEGYRKDSPEVSVPDARLALVVYERPAGDRVEVNGHNYARYEQFNGRTFELAVGQGADVVDGRGSVTVDLSGVSGPVVLQPWVRVPMSEDFVSIRKSLLGEDSRSELSGGVGTAGTRAWAVDRDSLTFSTRGWGDADGSVALLVYVPVASAAD